ncbi:hypothetical protein COOONC_18865 [Cooperia oncophora]
MDQRKKKKESETASASDQKGIRHVLTEEQSATVLGSTLTPKIADFQQRQPSRMQTEDTDLAKVDVSLGIPATTQIELDRTTVFSEDK